jgi:hypothetical protein
VLREDFATALTRMLVSQGLVAAPAKDPREVAAKVGLVRGDSDGHLDWTRRITRGEAALTIQRAINVAE